MKATIQTDGQSVLADFADCILHRTGEFAGNLDLSVQFSTSVFVKSVLDNLRVKLLDGNSLIDIAGYRETLGGYEVTLYSGLAPPGKDVPMEAVPASVELYWLSHSHDSAVANLAVKVSQAGFESSDTDDVLAPIRAALFASRKIDAIRLYREATGKGLAKAKEAVESLESELRASGPEHRARARIGEDVEIQRRAIGGVAELLRRRREVVLQECHLKMRQELGTLADEVGAAAQQIAGGAHRLRVDVRLGKRAAAQQPGELLSIKGVGLGLAAVDRLQVQRVAQYERNLLSRAEIGEPVPGKQALAADDQPIAIGRQRSEQPFGFRRQGRFAHDHAGGIDDAQGQSSGVQIDAAVESVLSGVESHHGLLGVGGA